MQVRKHRALALFAVLAIAACSGDTGQKGDKGDTGAEGATGATGPQGPKGDQGAPGTSAPLAMTEACAGCHEATLGEKHALPAQLATAVTVTSTTATDAAPYTVTIKFSVKTNGLANPDFNWKAVDLLAHNEDAFWVWYDATACPPLTGCQAAPNESGPAGFRTKIGQGPGATPTKYQWTLTNMGAGNYSATVTGFDTAPAQGTAFMLSAMAANGLTATAVAYLGDRAHDVVNDQACINCHGPYIPVGSNWESWKRHDVTFPSGIAQCVVCHNRVGSADPRLPGAGSGLMGLIHGIHNSKNMPDQKFTWTWVSNGNQFDFSVGFPGNMDNCATCHISDAKVDRLGKVKDAAVSFALCMSCHDDWNGFSGTREGGQYATLHRNFTAADYAACGNCHKAGGIARATISQFHNGLITERAGLIWDGADQSIVEGQKIKLAITGVKVTDKDVQVTWTASKLDGDKAYDPCNQDFTKGPVFFGYPGSGSSEGCTNTKTGCASNMDILRAYAQADDWVNDNYPGGTSPGQPKSTKLASSNTTCSNNVATSVLPLQAVTATKGIAALEGKPQVIGPNGNIIWARAQTPTLEFVVKDGSLPAANRRTIVDVDKCNACHLGTLYQHGGSRVDKIELCVMCHNPSSSEQNNRVGMGVTEAVAYDGKSGETYDLRTLVHAVHSAGESKVPLMYYRSNGIFFFGAKDKDGNLLGVKNWPNEADCKKCVDAEDGPLTWCKVYGSAAGGTVPVVLSDGTCKPDTKEDPLPVSTDGTWRPHRVREIHYSRPLYDCGACHVSSNPGLPDPRQAVAVTHETGDAPYNNLTNDVLVGPSAASCMTCHQSVDELKQFELRKHAYDNGWWPSTFENGRQTLIDAVLNLMADPDQP